MATFQEPIKIRSIDVPRDPDLRAALLACDQIGDGAVYNLDPAAPCTQEIYRRFAHLLPPREGADGGEWVKRRADLLPEFAAAMQRQGMAKGCGGAQAVGEAATAGSFTIYHYDLTGDAIGEPVAPHRLTCSMPWGRILHVSLADPRAREIVLRVWALVRVGVAPITRTFWTVPTGGEVGLNWLFIDTIEIRAGDRRLFCHLFEEVSR